MQNFEQTAQIGGSKWTIRSEHEDSIDQTPVTQDVTITFDWGTGVKSTGPLIGQMMMDSYSVYVWDGVKWLDTTIAYPKQTYTITTKGYGGSKIHDYYSQLKSKYAYLWDDLSWSQETVDAALANKYFLESFIPVRWMYEEARKKLQARVYGSRSFPFERLRFPSHAF